MSDIPITRDHSDHPGYILHTRTYALVVSPIVDKYKLSKVLMDGGSSINILYVDTLKRMGLSVSQLNHSNVKFHGIVPGRQASSMGQITLPVTFGNLDNFRTEDISFEVVPFRSAYHTIFGRPAYARFMARTCYIYSKLKMPAPKGIITISGDFKEGKGM